MITEKLRIGDVLQTTHGLVTVTSVERYGWQIDYEDGGKGRMDPSADGVLVSRRSLREVFSP